MDAIAIPYSHVRSIRTAARKTGTVSVEYTPSETGAATAKGLDKDGKVRFAASLATDGSVSFTTKPKRTPTKPKADTATDSE
jgi:hypothetical protein